MRLNLRLETKNTLSIPFSFALNFKQGKFFLTPLESFIYIFILSVLADFLNETEIYKKSIPKFNLDCAKTFGYFLQIRLDIYFYNGVHPV